MNDVLGWGLALGAGVVVSWVAYPSMSQARIPLALLRVAAVVIVVVLLLDLPIGMATPPSPLVALDASASWMRAGDTTAWRAAVDTATRVAGGASIAVFGDSVRDGAIPDLPRDAASGIGPLIQRAAAEGQRLIVVTDGLLDDPDALQQAVAGSRVIVMPIRVVGDRAVADINAPAEARAGDTVTLRARVVADGATAATSLRWLIDAALVADVIVPAIGAAGEAVVESRVVIPAGDSIAVLRAALPAGADVQSHNDTVSVVLRRGARQRVVIISTAPDADVRDVATALRANVPLPTDAYYRIAPGRWLRDGNFTPVDETVVRAAVRGATLAVLHGDTTVMGSPAALKTRALLLLAPPASGAPELVVRVAPTSPLQAALTGIVVESLPPLLASAPARGGVVALSAAPGMATMGATPIVTAHEGEVRRVVISAAGYSRWRARGGVSEMAFQALVGGATDWLLAARGRAAVPVPALTVQRAGAPVRWRRGAQPGALVTLVRDGDRATRRDSLRFGDAAEVTSPALDAGVWRGTVDGSAIVLPVSASREWLPTVVGLRSTLLNGEALAVRRGARSLGWLYLATVLLLAAEWLLRRRAGLR